MSTVDAFVLWLRALAGRLGALLREMTNAEQVLTAVWAVALFLGGFGMIGWGGWRSLVLGLGMGLLAWLNAPVVADALVARAKLREAQAEMLTVHAAKATGAPRVADVPCRHGDMHRFVYGPDGWVPAGPAPDTRPEPQEART